MSSRFAHLFGTEHCVKRVIFTSIVLQSLGPSVQTLPAVTKPEFYKDIFNLREWSQHTSLLYGCSVFGLYRAQNTIVV